MNDNTPTQTSEFVLRRLSDPIRLFGEDRPPELWFVALAAVLVAAFFYVGWMYIKDSRGVGPWWAAFLGVLRSSVYVILAAVFLLPAKQTWETTELRSKVLVLFDVSRSLTEVRDDVPQAGETPAKMPTRQDKVLQFLLDDQKAFLAGLQKKNPVAAYRFHTKLDENFLHYADGRGMTREEREERLADSSKAGDEIQTRTLPAEYLRAWLKPSVAADVPEGLDAVDRARIEKLIAGNKKLIEVGLLSNTNVGDSVLNLLNREINNKLQGVVVFTDGRSTQGGSDAFNTLEQRSRQAGVPLFVVGVGENRPQVRIEILSLRAPAQVQPEDTFRALVEVYGEGLANEKCPVVLELSHTKKEKGKEVALPLLLVEKEDKNNPGAPREEIMLAPADLTKPLRVTPPPPAAGGDWVFDPKTTPPRVEVEFPLDAGTLAKAAGITDEQLAGKRWELAETKEGEIKIRARVPRDRREVAERPEVGDAADLRVIKRPLKVLLFASAPTREYQFVRTLLVREVEKRRAELSIHLQLPPGRVERRTGVVQDVPPERLLSAFPDKLDAVSDKGEDRLYDLAEYDVIIAFDPDWTALSDAQLKLVERWADKGGGLIVVGGPINTLQMARPGGAKEKLKPILDLYPVILRDIRTDEREIDRAADKPWPLYFEGATAEMEFLKLEEEGEKGPPTFLDDWKEFFFGADKKGTAIRGFYNYYPVDVVKPGTVVVARFTDPQAKLKDNVTQQPFIVITDTNSPRRVIWIGAGETWRLRQYREAYHERFWTKLTRFAGSRNQGRLSRRIQLNMGRSYVANRPIDVEVKADGKDGEPLGPNAKPPKVTLKLPTGVAEREIPLEYEMKAKKGAEDAGRFTARIQPRSPGEYTLEVRVPETNDSQSQRFTVKEPDPEMENTRPDFETLYKLATPAAPVLNRMTDPVAKQELKQRLTRPKLEAAVSSKGTAAEGEPVEDQARLFFTLANADLIPACMITDVSTNRVRGAVTDLWDGDYEINVLWDWAWRLVGAEPPAPVKMSFVLTAVVGLLSLEWLTRKLLRLA